MSSWLCMYARMFGDCNQVSSDGVIVDVQSLCGLLSSLRLFAFESYPRLDSATAGANRTAPTRSAVSVGSGVWALAGTAPAPTAAASTSPTVAARSVDDHSACARDALRFDAKAECAARVGS